MARKKEASITSFLLVIGGLAALTALIVTQPKKA